MRKLILVIAVMMTALPLLSSGAFAQASSPGANSAVAPSKNPQASLDQDIALLRQDLRSQKKQLIAANLQLTDAEATKFWPVYDQYTVEQTKLGDQKVALIKEYAAGFGTVTNDQALSLLKRSLALDDQYTQLRTKYVPIINQVLPGTKTATFFQMDRRLAALADLQLASQIPFVQEQNK
ncbi:MAG TPA: hypothetical protein VF753_01055 [Terriglobales bacterium]